MSLNMLMGIWLPGSHAWIDAAGVYCCRTVCQSFQLNQFPHCRRFAIVDVEWFRGWNVVGVSIVLYCNGKNGNLLNNIRILSPKNRGYWSRKSHSVEKTPFFAVFGKVLTDRWLHGYWFVNGRFTKYEFARGKVSLHERPCFVVWKVMFEAMKHGLWCGQS